MLVSIPIYGTKSPLVNAFDVIADVIGVILGSTAYHFFNNKIND